MQHKSNEVFDLEWDRAVTVLTNALTRAIRDESGSRQDAIATAQVVHFAMCMDLDTWFDLAEQRKPLKVLPFIKRRDCK